MTAVLGSEADNINVTTELDLKPWESITSHDSVNHDSPSKEMLNCKSVGCQTLDLDEFVTVSW